MNKSRKVMTNNFSLLFLNITTEFPTVHSCCRWRNECGVTVFSFFKFDLVCGEWRVLLSSWVPASVARSRMKSNCLSIRCDNEKRWCGWEFLRFDASYYIINWIITRNWTTIAQLLVYWDTKGWFTCKTDFCLRAAYIGGIVKHNFFHGNFHKTHYVIYHYTTNQFFHHRWINKSNKHTLFYWTYNNKTKKGKCQTILRLRTNLVMGPPLKKNH